MENLKELLADWTLTSAAYILAIIIMAGVAAKQVFGLVLSAIWR